MFTREVADALRDVLPTDTVEVVNLGIEATNTYAIVDFIGDIIAQHPDAVMIYAGHNEYYGALGAGSTGSVGRFPSLIRLYLKLAGLRTFQLLRDLVSGNVVVRRSVRREQMPNQLESVAQSQRIPFDGPAYRAGRAQFRSNLRIAAQRFRDAGVDVLIGSLVSNLRDQPPLAALSTDGKEGREASAAYLRAQQALARGDSVQARTLYMRARDLDEVRFRAPTEFNDIVRRVARNENAVYVPVEEVFSRVAMKGIPGHDLILEHVHPTSHGYALLGRVFFTALQRSSVLGTRIDLSRLRSWDEYEKRMGVTPLDERIAAHDVQAVTTRWPFVPFSRQLDYHHSYKPVNLLDSLAFDVANKTMSYDEARMHLARNYRARQQLDSAALYENSVNR